MTCCAIRSIFSGDWLESIAPAFVPWSPQSDAFLQVRPCRFRTDPDLLRVPKRPFGTATGREGTPSQVILYVRGLREMPAGKSFRMRLRAIDRRRRAGRMFAAA